jgi:hypothetical protein
MARVLMIVQHPVKDYDTWRIEYDKAQPIRDKHGVTNATVFRNADDPDLKDAMARAGVSGPPRIEISEEM